MSDREIYLRKYSDGLGAEAHGLVPLCGRSSVCFFVHGYNVDEKAACEAFDRLVEGARREAQISRGVVVPSLDGANAWRIYWPAYGRLGRERWALSALTYPLHVADAEAWAHVLAKYLSTELKSPNNGVPVEITFVAHSLGCRLILEVLRSKLANHQNNWQVRLVFFMAAAVPVYLVEYDERLCRAAIDPAVSQVAYSPLDTVLQVPFRVGQMFEGGLLPTAVGSSGEPAVLWNKRIATRNGHDGYFSDPRIARHLAEALGLSVPLEPESRDVVRRPLATRIIESLLSPATRNIRSRQVAG